MYYVYVLQSQKTNKLYIGYTEDLRRRFQEHNTSRSLSTKSDQPWQLVYYEAFFKKEYACRREKALKDFGRAYGQLKKRIGL
ncbi:MAG: GIY-YIG nuclease family protein [Candidatus Magasanikbacteria bacterium]|nr:GIY-YIG nuclease family protein [Candidatus Magasanikbacteria bacterium]